MFTGLVQAKGLLVRRSPRGGDARLVISGELISGELISGEVIPGEVIPGESESGRGRVASAERADPVALGESIAIDGVCLTVDAVLEPGGLGPTVFEVDASSETLAKTTLGALAPSTPVNLERALPLGGRLGGHLVSGHVDGVGRVIRTKPVSGALEVTFDAPDELARFIAPKGSICISGVSLTVNRVSGTSFDVMLIPHTREKTSLDALTAGALVNLEVDLLARYVARLLEVGRIAAEPSPDSHLLERLRASGYV